MVEYHGDLSVDYRRACQGYHQCRVACAGFAGVVNIVNINANVSRCMLLFMERRSATIVMQSVSKTGTSASQIRASAS